MSGSHSYSIRPWLQPLCQLQSSSLRILSRPWFKTKQHNIKQCKTTPNPCRISQEKNCLRIVYLLVILRLECAALTSMWNGLIEPFKSKLFSSQSLLTEPTKYFYFSSKTCNLVLEMYFTQLFSVITFDLQLLLILLLLLLLLRFFNVLLVETLCLICSHFSGNRAKLTNYHHQVIWSTCF